MGLYKPTEKYSGSFTTCRKCGFGKPITLPFPVKYSSGNSRCETEHLQRTCPKCGYVWTECCVEKEK